MDDVSSHEDIPPGDAEPQEGLLVALRPQMSQPTMDEIERRVLDRPSRSRVRLRARQAVPALALTGAFAAGVFVAGLLGTGPASLDGPDDARGDCETITRTVIGGREIVRDAGGRVRVIPVEEPIVTKIRRCP